MRTWHQLPAAMASVRCFKGGSDSTQTTTTETQDKRITVTDQGSAFSLSDLNIDTMGAPVNITSNDPALAKLAVQTTAQTAKEVTEASNKIAAQVADSTSKLVDISSGQKNAVIIVIVAILAALGFVFFGRKKSA